jgi:DNA-binding NarL/FixJ family response regulator
VLLVDDHGIVRRGLRSLLETQPDVKVVAEAADGLEALRLAQEHQPDVVIIDIAMPKMNGIEVAERVQKLPRAPHVIILTMHVDESYIIRALSAGSRAYLLKDATDEELIPALRAVVAGRPYFSPTIASVLPRRSCSTQYANASSSDEGRRMTATHVTLRLIRVQREWNGWETMEVPIEELHGFHWFQPEGAPQPMVHGFLRDRRVCILKKHNAPDLYQEVRERAHLPG